MCCAKYLYGLREQASVLSPYFLPIMGLHRFFLDCSTNGNYWTLVQPEQSGTAASLTLTITNTLPGANYRTGVRLP